MLIICDLDGTICDLRGREKKAGTMPPRRQKKAFQMYLDILQPITCLRKDPPITPVLETIKALAKIKGNRLVYLTGRAEKYRKATQYWLRKNKCPRAPLIMRSNNDWRAAKDYKFEEMKKLVEKNETVLVFDDDPDGDCTKMYAKNGWYHLLPRLPNN